MRGFLTRAALCAGMVACTGAAIAPSALAAMPLRAYELVSPASKGGNDVSAFSARTRAAVDGDAVNFMSLGGFADVVGGGIAVDYMAIRTPSGWRTHAITPRQDALPFFAATNSLEPLYDGEFAPDLSAGVFRAFWPVPTADDPHPMVALAQNLYRRMDLRVPGPGSYELLSDCPACVSPLPPAFNTSTRPAVVGGNVGTDVVKPFQHVVFESTHRLVTGAVSGQNLYEADGSGLHLVGRVPVSGASCDDANGPACTPSSSGAISGLGVLNGRPTENAISPDGSRIVFTAPQGTCGVNFACGNIFVRMAQSSTEQVNVSETNPADPQPATQPATFWGVSADGTRVVFATAEQMTADDTNTVIDLYMANMSRSPGQRLVRLSAGVDDSPSDVEGVIGMSSSGDYVYFIAPGELVAGQPTLAPTVASIYAWHAGALSYIGGIESIDVSLNTAPIGQLGSLVTPDGLHVAFTATEGGDLTGYDHGTTCGAGGTVPCQQIYVYSAASRTLACASCSRLASVARAAANFAVRTGSGVAVHTTHLGRALVDGGRVFFSTREALVPDDTNGQVDAYEYDADSQEQALISSGSSASDSFFMDASATGDDVFFVTRERLVGWDVDNSYDLYDARVGGGFPEPVAAVPCGGAACQGLPPGSLAADDPSSEHFSGSGNEAQKKRSVAKRSCRRGTKRKRVQGRIRCVKRKHHRRAR